MFKMKNIRIYHAFALGESHRIKNIPCQDATQSFEDRENGIFIAAVSDGHGSKQYFRSDRGSRFLVKIVLDTIRDFIRQQDKQLLAVPFTAIPSRKTEVQQQNVRKFTLQDDAFRRVFSAIIAAWNEAVHHDWENDPPTPDQMKDLLVPDAYISSYQSGNEIEMAYGCTLIAFTQTPDYWFAFQLGDGKCIAFDGEAKGWEPVPWDDQCIGNTTTSICDSAALDNFRYCYGKDKTPFALFIGSDGMDGAYGTIDEFSVPLLTGLYENVIKSFARKGYDATVAEIREMLPELSEQGVTRDDVSLAGWIDLDWAKSRLPIFLNRDIEKTEKEIAEIEKALELKHKTSSQLNDQITRKKSVFEKKKKDTREAETELSRAEKEYLKAEKRRAEAQRRHANLKSEVDKIEGEILNAGQEIDKTRTSMEKEQKLLNDLQKKLRELNSDYNDLQSGMKNEEKENPEAVATLPVSEGEVRQEINTSPESE
jgi:serine/threonine protein phosphatase PrpC